MCVHQTLDWDSDTTKTEIKTKFILSSRHQANHIISQTFLQKKNME